MFFLLLFMIQQSVLPKTAVAQSTAAQTYETWYPVQLSPYYARPAFIDKKGKVKLSFDSSYTLLGSSLSSYIFDGQYTVLAKFPPAEGEPATYFTTDRKGKLKAFPSNVFPVAISKDHMVVHDQYGKFAIWRTDLTPVTAFDMNTPPALLPSGKSVSHNYSVVYSKSSDGKNQVVDTKGKVVYEGYFKAATFMDSVAVITTENSGFEENIRYNHYKYIDYLGHIIWQPSCSETVFNSLTAIEGCPVPAIRKVRLGRDMTTYTLEEVAPLLKQANLSLLQLRVKDDSTTFPMAITQMTNLQSLDLSYCKFTGLPKEIGKLKHLQDLQLNYTLISELPESLYELKELRSIGLEHTHLTLQQIAAFKEHMPRVTITFRK